MEDVMHYRSLPQLALTFLLLSAVAPVGNAAEHSVGQSIRDATGLRFSSVESIIRRNVISTRTPYGFKIKSVDAASAGARAGLKSGDVLLEWDGKPIKSRKKLNDWLADAERGKPIPIIYARHKSHRSPTSRSPWHEVEATMTLD